MKTLHVAIRIAAIDRSLAFYTALGYHQIGQIAIESDTTLVFLKLPGDPFTTIELVFRSGGGAVTIGDGFHHLVVQVDDLEATIRRLGRAGLAPEPSSYPGGVDGPMTSWLTDPDGYRIELVQWPEGHADGITGADLP